ncbi:MAG: hypothetical protein ACJ74Z_16155 [Bryobacteraceae bacterium]
MSTYLPDILSSMPDKKRKAVGLFIRLSDEEKDALQTAADQDERPLADWVRLVARQKLRERGLFPGPEKKAKKKQ